MMYYEAMDLYGRIPVLLSSADRSSMNRRRLFGYIKLSAPEQTGEIHFISSGVQQVLPYLPQTSSLEEGSLWAHHAAWRDSTSCWLNWRWMLKFYMYNDWAQGWQEASEGVGTWNLWCVLPMAPPLITGGKARWEPQQDIECMGNLHLLLQQTGWWGLQFRGGWNLQTVLCRYLMPKDALVMDEGWFCSASTTSQTSVPFRMMPMCCWWRLRAMERNDRDGRAEYNMVRRMPVCLRASLRCQYSEDRQVVLAGETCHRQGPYPFQQVPQVIASSPFCSVRSLVLFHRLPDTSAEPCLQWQSWFRIKDMRGNGIAKNSSSSPDSSDPLYITVLRRVKSFVTLHLSLPTLHLSDPLYIKAFPAIGWRVKSKINSTCTVEITQYALKGQKLNRGASPTGGLL